MAVKENLARKEKIETKKNKKRELIIEAASELFSKKNFHEVMMEDVAKLASIAKGTLYNYFDSKEDLYFSIMVIRMENLINSLREKIKKEVAAADSLHSFVIHNYMFMVKYSCFFLMSQRDTLTADNSYCAEYKLRKSELKELLKDIIESGKKEKLFRNIETEFACDLVLGSVHSAVSRAIDNKFSNDVLDLERESVFDFILKGVASAETKADDTLPLLNKNIVITRSTDDSKDSSSVFSEKGANVISFPTLEIVPPSDWRELDKAVKAGFDILIFTSVNAVRMFMKRSGEASFKIDYDNLLVVTVGKKTAALCQRYNIPVNLVPKEFSGEGLIRELSALDLKGKRILIPSSAIARDELPRALENMGALVMTPVVYAISLPSQDVLSPAVESLCSIIPDLFVFTSPSTFRNFLQIMNISEPERYFNGYRVAAIGPTTSAEIEKENVRVSILPEEYTMEGLLKAAIAYFSDYRHTNENLRERF